MQRRVFVIRGFGTKKDSAGQSIDFERVHAALVAPALERCDLAGDTTIEVVELGNIRADMFALIVEFDISNSASRFSSRNCRSYRLANARLASMSPSVAVRMVSQLLRAPV
jgi:hypothetical protein